MEPDNNNQPQQDATPPTPPAQVPSPALQPEVVKQTVQEYSQYKDTTTRKKILFIMIFLVFGILLAALIFLLTYNPDGSRTEENIEQIQQETVPSGNVEEPDAE